MAIEAFAQIPAGVFTMGANDAPHPEDGEGPPREVDLSAYNIAIAAVSNEDFARFVTATGYVTVAERAGGSLVFRGQLTAPESHAVPDPVAPWWHWVEGASWHQPIGSGAALPDIPVVHIAHEDATAFCQWSGGRLPTEAEWECAASYQPVSNPHIWQGRFPDAPMGVPGPRSVLDAGANGHGLRHTCGNVWEWTADRFARLQPARRVTNPTGPLNGDRRVLKGGSFLCCPSYCARFRPTSRRGDMPLTTAGHTGFRLARDS